LPIEELTKENDNKNYIMSGFNERKIKLMPVLDDEQKNKSLYSTISINNRRYLGNKYKLNEFIKNIISEHCGDFGTFADLFAGTGAVAAMFQNKHLIVNDILYSNYVCHQTWFGYENYSQEKIINFIKKYNEILVSADNYMSKNYSDTYFSRKNCKKIGFIREDIEKNFNSNNLNNREKCILITSLLYAMDKIANTCGHYDAYRKNGELDKKLELLLPKIEETNFCNELYNEDINKLVKVVKADVVYLDPPYNSRQYCDAYHLLENVARWKKPDVIGIAKKMDRTSLKSNYCTQSAVMAFEDLINNISAKYIVLSYNNMAEKGNDRSNAKLSDSEILRILNAKGTVKVFSQHYKAFSTGKSSIEENAERLFVCKCYAKKKPI
jgi:adenine-specific DNA-methyltransferase